jgi:hypothetical protein
MKKMIVALMICLPFAAGAEEDVANLTAEGKQVIKAFFGDLKGELVKGMKEGGPVHTIDVCSKVAPNLAEAHSQMSGWQVARTSLKPRNTNNAPDDWETQVLQEFEIRKAAGEDPAKLVQTEIVEQKGHKVFRMMKAIPTVEVCTKCHGVDLQEPVVEKLDELYPEDQARGFKVGDLRGAFTLKKDL